MNGIKKMNLLISVFFITLGFGNLFFSNRDWGSYTNMVYVLAGILGLLLLADVLLTRTSQGKPFRWGLFETGISITVAVSVVLIPFLGFYTTMLPATVIVSQLSRSGKPSKAETIKNTLFALAVTAAVFLIFSLALGLKTPRGVLI